MDFLEFLSEEGITEASKWQKPRRQTAGHKAKKAKKRSVSAKKKKPSKEMKRLAGISAKREVKDNISRSTFRKKFSDLSPDQKEKINEKMKQNDSRQRVLKLTQEKFLERQKKQREKDQKAVETKKKETTKRKETKQREDTKKKKDVEKKDTERFEKKLK